MAQETSLDTNLTEVSFVLDSLHDWQIIADAAAVRGEVVVLDASENVLQQMTEYAQSLEDSSVDAIHLFSHGYAGALELGEDLLTFETLDAHAGDLAEIGSILVDAGDLLLYGCNVAAGSEGENFVSALADQTEADVAASDHTTGAALLGGDWDLEYLSGSIEVDGITVNAYSSSLASGMLLNQYIKVGFSDNGTLGWGSNVKPGIQYDPDGAFNFLDTADYLTPGSPWEVFTVAIGDSNYTNNNTSPTSGSVSMDPAVVSTTVSDGKIFGSVNFTGSVAGLEISQTYTLGENSEVITFDVSIENATDADIVDVKYLRAIDPDVDSNGLPGSTARTTNERGATDIEAEDIVLATGPESGRIIGYYSDSSFEHNTGITNWTADPDPYLSGLDIGDGDNTVGIGFDLGTIAAGGFASFSFATVFAGSAADLSDSISQVGGNPAPTLTAFADVVDTVNEDTRVQITFDELASKGDEADEMLNPKDPLEEGDPEYLPGEVDAFVVSNVDSGTLMIGESAATATAWAAGTNDVIDAEHYAYWTPAADDNGAAVDAFSVRARDAEGKLSSSSVTAQVEVIAVNDAPEFSRGADQIVDQDSGLHTVNGWATGISAGADNEADQTLAFDISNSNNEMFSVQPTVSADGTLQFAPAAGVSGEVSVNLFLTDDGGTAHGGVDQSLIQTFTITIEADPDAPEEIPDILPPAPAPVPVPILNQPVQVAPVPVLEPEPVGEQPVPEPVEDPAVPPQVPTGGAHGYPPVAPPALDPDLPDFIGILGMPVVEDGGDGIGGIGAFF